VKVYATELNIFGSAFETCKRDISLNWVAINMYQCDIPCSSQGYIKDM
jgi:hypothetical protein